MICLICDTTEKVINHHLSYEPEITIPLCTLCHKHVHLTTKFPKKPKKEPLTKIERGLIISRRKIFPVGDSIGITLPKIWLTMQELKYQRVPKCLAEIASKNFVVLIPEDEITFAKSFILEYENNFGDN